MNLWPMNHGAGKTYIAPSEPVVKTVTLELVRKAVGKNPCYFCVFGDPTYAVCPFPDEGRSIGCVDDDHYFRVKEGAA